MTPDPVDTSLDVWFEGALNVPEYTEYHRARMRRVLDAHDARALHEPGRPDLFLPGQQISRPRRTLNAHDAGRVHTALIEIATERRRQIEVEGWTANHDDHHTRGEMALAAASYCLWSFPSRVTSDAAKQVWPWSDAWFKPKDMRRDLIRAAALIVAEIERLDRKP